MPAAIPLAVQTMYAELAERCAVAGLDEVATEAGRFPVGGGFVVQRHGGRDYWYFQSGSGEARRQKYVGPDTPELRARIDVHRTAKDDFKERRVLVAALKRAGLAAPDAMTGRVLEALAAAGAFRMRAVLVGTAAYRLYGGSLGVRLAAANLGTGDVDLAQFAPVSKAVGDALAEPFLDVLRRVDPGFRALPHPIDRRAATQYALGDRFRVEALTPNRGPDDERPIHLPALRTEATPLRFLDFLIRDEERVVALHGGGILVNVPAPQRYALHKLLVSRMRIQTRQSQEKAAKDLRQAAELIVALAASRPHELSEAWEELRARGPKWRRLADEAVELLPEAARTRLFDVAGGPAPVAGSGGRASVV